YRRGRCVEISGVVRDVTARKEQELDAASARVRARESSEKYRAVFEVSPDAIAITRVASREVLEANDAALNTLGYRREQVIGRRAKPVIFWAAPEERVTLIERLKRERVAAGVAVRMRRADGTIIEVLLSCALIEIEGVDCIVWSWRDVSDLRRTEAALQELNA